MLRLQRFFSRETRLARVLGRRCRYFVDHHKITFFRHSWQGHRQQVSNLPAQELQRLFRAMRFGWPAMTFLSQHPSAHFRKRQEILCQYRQGCHGTLPQPNRRSRGKQAVVPILRRGQ